MEGVRASDGCGGARRRGVELATSDTAGPRSAGGVQVRPLRDGRQEWDESKFSPQAVQPSTDPRKQAPPPLVKFDEFVDTWDSRTPFQVRRVLMLGIAAPRGRGHTSTQLTGPNLSAQPSVMTAHPLIIGSSQPALDGLTTITTFLVGPSARSGLGVLP